MIINKPIHSVFSQRGIVKRQRGNAQERTGALTVEVALCLPILLMVLFGGFELCYTNMLIHSTESAAYAGARVGIIPGATPDRIRAEAGASLRAVGIKNFTVTVTPNVIQNDTQKVTVDIAVPFRANTSFPAFYVNDPTFRGSCTLTRETL